MSSLIGSAKTTENASMRARTSAAVRRVAAEQQDAPGAAGTLAHAALLNPDFVVPSFLVRITVNPNVAALSCSDCGYAAVEDNDILYIVTSTWAEVAESEYPTPDTEI